MKMKLVMAVALAMACFSCNKDSVAPRVVSTVPDVGDQSVDPSLSRLSVTFSEPMMDGNWSWAYTRKEEFPEMTGDPQYEGDFTTNVLPVKLESNKEYVIWINSPKFQNFKDKAGNPSVPYKLVFRTR